MADYLAAMPGWTQGIGRTLDALITKHIPGVRKAVKWNTPFYGLEGKGWCVSFHCFTHYVKVTFFNGSDLKPLPPGASKVPNVRYLDIRATDVVDETQFANWLKQAASLPGWSRVE